jgi:glutamyl-tRNA reductase
MKKKQKSLEKAKKKKFYMGAGIILFLAALFTFSLVTGRDSEEKEVERIKDGIISAVSQKGESVSDIAEEGLDNIFLKNPRNIPKEKLQEIGRQMQNISPEARKRLIKNVAMARMKKVKEKMEGMSPEEKQEMLKDTLDKIRDRFANMDDKEKQRMRDMLGSSKGKEDMDSTLNTYFNDLSSEDRQALDPVMYEVMSNLNNL